MNPLSRWAPSSAWFAGLLLLANNALNAATDPTPDVANIQINTGRPVLRFNPVPAAVSYSVYGGSDLAQPLSLLPGSLLDFQWTGNNPATADVGFYRVQAQTLSPAALTAANLLQRIAYGPTPDDLDEITRIGVDAYIEQQLNPESIAEDLDTPQPFVEEWRKVTITGVVTSSTLYIYLDGEGDVYLDGLRLVAGSTDNGTAPNLIRNGDFDTALGNEWAFAANVNTSARSAQFAKTGNASLHLIATEGGSSLSSSLSQVVTPRLVNNGTYTLSYWYYTANTNRQLTIRFSGATSSTLAGTGIAVTHGLSGANESLPSLYTPMLEAGTATISQLRSWHLMKAVASKRQLNEVLRQFCENHFVTQYGKSNDYFDGVGYPNEVAPFVATQVEYIENKKWQAALLRPNVTFHDLLRISAESPAMIIFLDTVNSRGNRNSDGTYRIANENYARELCELFCFGVDNGYDQGDIVQISRVWTGWTTQLRAPADVNNPFALQSTVYKDPTLTTNRNALTNLVGTWTLRYSQGRHDPRPKYLFHEKNASGAPIANSPRRVPARFGPPWAGRSYGLAFTTSGNTTNTIQEGYTVLRHMADQPFTQEFIVVKLCRLFVHDDFQVGYDFTDAETSPEEDLVKAAMLTWENPPGGGPKGQLRPVIRTILHSSLFRSSLASQQKIKTPLEYSVSALRAFRTDNGDGTFTASSNGVGLQAPMNRAGRMRLFDRAEPDGYSESGQAWISAGTLAERLRYVQALSLRPANRPSGELDSRTVIDPVALLRRKKPAALTDAAVAADYFLELLFPGEGPANLQPYRDLAIRFLNTADNGTTASAYSSLSAGTTAHDTRVRGLVSFLMTTSRFNEQ
jgi:uncharacterized protein (DUF1800 family)